MTLLGWIRTYILAIAAVALTGSVASAQTVTLEFKTGGFKIHGKLLKFDASTYTMQSDVLGIIRVDRDKFTCSGVYCPEAGEAFGEPVPGVADDSEDEPKAAKSEEPGIVRIVGSSTIGSRLVPELIRDYAESLGASINETEKDNAHVTFEIVGKDGKTQLTFELARQGSSTAFAALASGEADIGASDRPIADTEVGAIAEAGTPGMNRPEHEYVIGLDGILVISSPKNEVDSLSTENIAQIFAGEITDWSELGYPPAKINVYAMDENSGTYLTFRSLLLRPFKKELTPTAKRFKSYEELAKAVSADPGGIGIASFAQVDLARPVAIRDTCGLTYAASKFSVKTGEYPLSRNLYFYVREPNQHARDFLNFAISEAAEPALNKSGFIDDDITTARFRNFRDRVVNSINGPAEDFNLAMMQELITSFEKGMRLSATMRFETGSSDLDSESVQSLPDVATYLKNLPKGEFKILVVGFSDRSGWFEQNRVLSFRRADTVREALLVKSDLTISPADIEARGYAELFPAACNDTKVGRDSNRRVEVWLIPTPNASPSILTKQF